MSAILQRYGATLRIYDNGGKTADRYTIVPPRWAHAHRQHDPRMFYAIGCNETPCHPQGIGCSTTAMPGKHLGKRVHWQDLPKDVQRVARQHFPEYAPLDGTVTYHRNPTPAEIRFGEGATHYRDFERENVRVPNTTRLKRWIYAEDEGVRYYR